MIDVSVCGGGAVRGDPRLEVAPPVVVTGRREQLDRALVVLRLLDVAPRPSLHVVPNGKSRNGIGTDP
jgi:hypothetical protein